MKKWIIIMNVHLSIRNLLDIVSINAINAMSFGSIPIKLLQLKTIFIFSNIWNVLMKFSSTTTVYSWSLHSNNNFYFSNSWFQSWLYTGKWIFKLYSITSFYFLWECCIHLSILFYKFWMKLKTIKFKRYCKILPIFLDQRRIY